MDEERDIVNSSSSQEQLKFLGWLAEDYPDFFKKVEKEFWEDEDE